MLILLLLPLAYFAFLYLVAGRVQKLQDGIELPNKGILNRNAHYQRRRLIERGKWNYAVPDHTAIVHDRTPAEVDEQPEGWVPYAEHLAQIDRADIGASGRWARFEYVDADGVITKRNITMWEKRGRYVVGFDRSRKEERTFRQDRISDWVCG